MSFLLVICAATAVIFIGLALAEPLLRKMYIRHVETMAVAQKAEERILTYPLA